MRLPCLLLIEPDMPEGVSARKLVLESSKLNVISAYTAKSGLANYEAFPNVDAVVLHTHMRDWDYQEVFRQIRMRDPSMRFIFVCPQPNNITPSDNVAVVDAFDPTSLLFVAQRWMEPEMMDEAGD